MAIKPSGLGVLDDYEALDAGLKGIRTNLSQRDRDKAIADAKNMVKDLLKIIAKSKRDAAVLKAEIDKTVKQLTEVLPFIAKRPK